MCMCESTVYLDEEGEVTEVMQDVTRIVMEGSLVKLTNIIGEQIVLENVRFKEANLLSHGLVFERA
jgi:predicted RNA-binding protein